MTWRAVLTVAGQVIGASFGPVGSAIGGAIGGAVGGAIDGPMESSQALLEDLDAIKFDYGATWPRMYGRYRHKVSPIWSSIKRPVPTVTEGGDCLSGETEQKTYTYEMDWLCWAPLNATGFCRVWINGELKYSTLAESDADTLTASLETTAWAAVTFFDGNAAQLPWAIYEAAVGTADASAYRHRPTLAFESLDLGRSGQPPLVEVEFFTAATAGQAATTQIFNLFDPDGTIEFSSYTAGGSPPYNATAVQPNLDFTEYDFDAYQTNGAFSNTSFVVESSVAYDFAADAAFAVECNIKTDVSGGPGASPGAVAFARYETSGPTLWYFAHYNSDMYFVCPGIGVTAGQLSAPLTLGVYNKFRAERIGLVCSIYKDDVFVASRPCSAAAVVGPCRITINGAYQAQPLPNSWGNGTYNIYFGLKIFSGGATVEPQAADLADIVSSENLLEWSSETGALTAADIDVSALVGTEVTGYATTGSPRESTAQLMDVFYFGAVCSDKLYYRDRGAAAVDTIAFDETGSGVGEASEPFTGMERGNDLEVASQVALTGPNILWDYEPGTEHSDLLVGESFELRRYQTPVVFTPAQRKGRADTMVHDGRIASHTAMVSLDDRHVELEPFDVWLQLDDEGNSYRVRAERETYSDSGRAFDVVLDDAAILSSSGLTVATDSRTITIALPDDTVIELLDVPILRDADNDPGFYAVAKGSTAGSALYSSLNAVTYTREASFAAESVFGTATTTLGNWTGGRVFDEKNSVTVNIGEGTLTSSTRTLLLADQSVNAFALGVHGQWELGQFRTPELLSTNPNIYKLTGLLRGSRGTDWASTGHTSGETFVLITGAGRRVDTQTSELGLLQYYKGISVGRSIASANAETFINSGVGLKPFSPVDVRKTTDSTGAITITWRRRTRLASLFVGPAGSTVPLGEASESYEIDVLNGATVLRTLTASTQTVDYTTVQQGADGVTGATALEFVVYQLNANVGRGYPSSGLAGVGGRTAQAQIATVTIGGVFASGVVVFVTIAGVKTSYTTVVGDVNLNGVAASLAAAMTGYTGYTIGAVGSVITIAGPVGAPFTIVTGLTGGGQMSTSATQAAAAQSEGSSKQIQVSMTTPFSATAGATFQVRFENSVVPGFGRTVTYAHTAYAGESAQNILVQLAADTPTTSDFAPSGISWNFINGVGLPPVAVFPVGQTQWTGYAFSTEGQIFFSTYAPGSSIVPAATPQVTDFALVGYTGAPTVGDIYRITLGATNFDHTVSGGNTYATVMTALAASIDADALYLGSTYTVPGVPAEITTGVRVTAATANLPFTYSGQSIPGSVSLATAITQSAT